MQKKQHQRANPKRRKRTLALVLAALLAGLLGWWTFPPPAAKLNVSKPVTYFTSPVRSDGTIDYLAALNAHLSQGVTADNNAFAMVVQTMPGYMWSETAERLFVFDEVGVDPSNDEAPSFVPFDAFGEARGFDASMSRGDAFKKFVDEQRAALSESALTAERWEEMVPGRPLEWNGGYPPPRVFPRDLIDQPWRAEDYPLMMAWLETNESALRHLAQAVEREHWYAPLWSAGDSNSPDGLSALMPWLGHMREIGEALALRAQQHVARGELDAAFSEVWIALQLSRYPPQTRMLISHLVGFNMRATAWRVVEDIASSPALTAAQARDMLEKVSSLPPLSPMADTLGLGERIVSLDMVLFVWRQGALLGIPHIDSGHAYDPNIALRTINKYFDALEHIGHIDEYPAYRKAADKVYEQHIEGLELDENAQWFDSWKGQLALALAPAHVKRDLRTAKINNVLYGTVFPALSYPIGVEWELRQLHDLARVALALGGYRADHGEYPERLDALSPQWLEQVPMDLFNHKPLRYERRAADVAVLYSVGRNMNDDGGRTSEDDPDADDLVVRLEWSDPAEMNPAEERGEERNLD